MLVNFELNISAELPGWATELLIQRTLWKEFGVSPPAWDAGQMMKAVRLANALEERKRHT